MAENTPAHEVVRQPGVDGPYLDDVRAQQESAYRDFKNKKAQGLVEVGLSTDSEVNSHKDSEGETLPNAAKTQAVIDNNPGGNEGLSTSAVKREAKKAPAKKAASSGKSSK